MANEVTNLEQAIKDWKSGMAPEDAAKKNQISRTLLERTIVVALNPMNTNDEVVGDTVSFQKIKQDLQKMPVLEVVLENSDPSKNTTLICYQTADGVKSVLPYDASGQLIDLDAVYREYGIKKILVDSDGKVTIDSDKEINYNQIGFKDKNKNVSFWNKFSDYAKDIKAAFLRNEQQTPQAEANNLVKDFQAKIAAGDKKGAQEVQSKIAEFLTKHPDLANILQVALQPIPDFSTKTQTVKQVEDTYTPQNINDVLDIIGINTNTNDGKKILERMSLLPQEILNKIKQNIGDIKEAFFSNELEPTFDNVSNVLEFLEGVTLRNEEEYTSSESQRQEIITQIKAANFMATLYETVANNNDQYTDNLGLFGLGSEGIGYVMNKLHLDGENHYQWADSCREWAKNSSELKVLNPQKFKEGFKKIYGDNAKNWGIDYNSDAFKKCFALAENGKAYDKDNKMTAEYKDAIKEAMNFVAENPNDDTFNKILNGFGEAVLMIATLGWGAETKAGTTLATTTMGTFSKAGVAIASKQVNNKLLQGALRFTGKAVKLVGPALNEGVKMYLYTAAEGTLTNVSNRAIKQDDKFLETQAGVMTNAEGSFTFGAFAGVFGSTVTQRVMQAVSKTSSKVTTALADKFSQGPVDANKVFATIMEKSVPTRIAEVAAFATDIVGFTAFESALTIANTLQREGSLTPEELANTLMEEFKNQGYSLGQIKVISHLIMTLVGSRSARMQSQKYLQENLPQLKGATVEWLNGGKDGFKINLPNGKTVECKNASEMIASIQLMSRGETALSRLFNNNSKSVSKKVVHKAQAETVAKDVAPKAEEVAPHDNVLNELQKREDTVKNGELPTIKDVKFDEGFGLSYKASTNPLIKGEWTFNGKKVANSKKELLAQLKEQGIEVPNSNTDIDRLLAKLKTKEDFQNASICLYQTKNIWALDFNLVKTPEDAVICGMLAEKRANYDNSKRGLKAIKENPALYKVFNEGIDALNSKVGYPDDSYMIYDAAKQLDTPQKCEAFLELVKNNNEDRYALRELITDNLLPQNINEVESFTKILNYRGCTRFTRNAYLKLPEEVRNVLNKHLETHTYEQGYTNSFDYNICQKLIEGLKNKETQAELMKLISGAKDFETLETIYRSCLSNKYDKETLSRINSLISSGLEYINGVGEYIDKSPENKFYASEEYFQSLLNSLKNEAFKSKIGRTPTISEAKTFGKIKEDWKKEYALSKINAEMKPYEVENALYEASMVESKEQIDLADILSTIKGDSVTFYEQDRGWGIRTDKRDLYKYLTTKEDIEAFKELQKHLPLKIQKDGYFYQKLIENGRLAKGCTLINSCRSLKEACQEQFNNAIENVKNEFQENVLLSLNTLCEKRPELGKALEYKIEELVKNCDSKEKADLIKKNIETLIGADKDFVEIVSKNYYDTNVIKVLTSENFDLEKYELVKPYIKEDGWENGSTAVKIAISKTDKETLKKALKVSTELDEVLSFTNSISSENKRLANTILDDKVALKDIENVISMYPKYRDDATMRNNIFDNRLKFYNEFKNDKRFSQEEFINIVSNIDNGNIALAKKLCKNGEFPKEHIADIVRAISKDNIAFAEKLCADKEFPKEHVADILWATTKDNVAFAEKLCADKEFPKEHIANILEATNKDKITFAEKLCADKEFPKEHIANILRATNKDNVTFTEKLCADKEFPKEHIADIVRATNKDNVTFTEKLCADKEFPKEHIADIVRATNKDNIAFAEKLCADKEFPKEYIANILRATNKDNIAFAEKIYNNKKINPKHIRMLIQNVDNINVNQYLELQSRIGNEKLNSLTDDDVIIGSQFASLIGCSSINEIPLSQKKNILRALVSNNRDLFCTSDNLKEIIPILPKNQEEYCELLPSLIRSMGIETNKLTPEQVEKTDVATKNLSKSLAKLSDSDFASLSIRQEYSREEFINTVIEKTKNLSETERQKVFDYYGFELLQNDVNKTGYTLYGYPVNLNNGHKLAEISAPKTKSVVEDMRADVVRFSKDNKIKCENREVEQFLNEIVEVLPEIRTMIGKAQHGNNGIRGAHDFDVMKHSLKVMQKISQDPNYEKLSTSDKKVMMLASLLHDITKAEGHPDGLHAENGAFDIFFIAKKFNLTSEEETKLYKICKYHEWLNFVNTSENDVQLTKRLQSVAFDLQQDNLVDMAAIFTHADLRAVKSDDSFHDTKVGKARVDFNGNVRSFGESADIYIERIKEYQKELQKSQPLLPVTKMPQASRIKQAITVVKEDGSTNIKGVYQDKNGLVVIKFNEMTDESWVAAGFPKGTSSKGVKAKGVNNRNEETDVKTGNIHFFVHGLDYQNQLAKFDAFSLVDSDALLSVSYAERPESKYRFFRSQGVLLNIPTKYVYGGGNTDSGSGCGKNIQNFKDRYIFGAERESDRLYVSNLIKEATGMNDAEYIKFVKENENKSMLEIQPAEIREKIIQKFATINSNVRRGNREYNEMYASNPEVMGVFAYKWSGGIGNPLEFLNSRKNLQFLRNYAIERDFPFVVFGD